VRFIDSPRGRFFPVDFSGLKSGHKGLIFVSQLDLVRVQREKKACNRVLVLMDKKGMLRLRG